jgi:hypothetical protein
MKSVHFRTKSYFWLWRNRGGGGRGGGGGAGPTLALATTRPGLGVRVSVPRKRNDKTLRATVLHFYLLAHSKVGTGMPMTTRRRRSNTTATRSRLPDYIDRNPILELGDYSRTTATRAPLGAQRMLIWTCEIAIKDRLSDACLAL